MAKINFTVSARAGKLLGRENFSNPEGAIIELVKNAYDADAKNCFVFFDIPVKKEKDDNGKEIKIPIKKDSSIYIIDNGDGMTKEIIENHWMKIGTGNKEKDFISDDKRVKTGAKGIGRFALDRLGFETEMWTLSKKTKDTSGLHWKMDWTQFDNADITISEIKAELNNLELDIKDKIRTTTKDNSLVDEIVNDINFNNGTIIKIYNLKDDWFETEIQSVFRDLEALIPPKQLNIPFEVFFKHLQESKEYGKVETAFFNDFDYKVKAFYNSEELKVDFEITRNELDVKRLQKEFPNVYSKSVNPYDLETLKAASFTDSKSIDKVLKWKLNKARKKLLEQVGSFELTFFYLKQTNSRKEGYPFKTIVSKERRATLERFGGVKIYRDSFRVRPYGDPTDDWLKLGARAASSPAGAGQRVGDWRVRPESTAGIITISRKENPLLIDKSDRGSLQENDAFDTFKKIIIGVIHEFEIDRSKMLNPVFIENKKRKEEARENEIEIRAKALAKKMVEDDNKVEEEVYGERQKKDLFTDKRDEQKRKNYEESFKGAFEEIENKIEEQIGQEIVQVRSLASLGLVVSSFAHELKEIRDNATDIKDLDYIFKAIIPEEVKKSQEYKDGKDIIELLDENSDKIIHWVDYALTSIKKDKRKRGKFEFSSFFESLKKSWSRIFKKKDIHFSVDDNIESENYNFRAFEMDIATIFSNLINNSIDSFDNLNEIQERKINVELQLKNDNIEIKYSDNGVGLAAFFEEKEEIFLPFTTSKKDNKGNEIGTGLGMYLVKAVIDDNNGIIDILDKPKGFTVLISFPIRKREV